MVSPRRLFRRPLREALRVSSYAGAAGQHEKLVTLLLLAAWPLRWPFSLSSLAVDRGGYRGVLGLTRGEDV